MRLLSPRELADALGVSESSLKRWVDAGKITAARTEGGHRRIAMTEAVRFIRESGAPLARPELLDLPEVAVAQQRAADGNDRLLELLSSGDAVGTRGWLMARYLGGATIAELCDGPIQEAMHALGELWRHERGGIFIEHRGTDLCLQALAQLRNLHEPVAAAPLALGGAPEDDPYLLPSFMAAAVLASAGMRAVNLGADTPIGALQEAITREGPRLVWLSISSELRPSRSKQLAEWLAELPRMLTIVVGGQRVDSLAPVPPHVLRRSSMAELATVATALTT